MKDFKKANYSNLELQIKIENITSILEKELPKNYKIMSVNGSVSNGISIYASVLRDGETKNFTFRISNHKNGNKINEIADGTFSYQMQGLDIDRMRAFYGEISFNDAYITLLQKEIKRYKTNGKENTTAFKMSNKNLLKAIKKKYANNFSNIQR